ncbi:MAG TPA: hypothetical protein VGR28_11445 [Candidatus Thermoplasmatota archaeon]|nr:hypothetical protein [Candidatus Thermoplasmatota archaeon]
MEPREVRAWLRDHPPDLDWLGKPGWHQIRWRDLRGAWHTARRPVRSGRELVSLLDRAPPADVFVGTAAWLDPARLPRLGDARAPRPILLDHLVAFDLDERPCCLARLERARRAAVRLCDWIERATALELEHVAFSGAKGFHVVARDPDRAPFREPNLRAREAKVRAARQRLLDAALAAGHPVDPVVTADTRRVLRLPGTLHGATGWPCSVVPLEALDQPIALLLATLPKPAWATPFPRWRPPPRPQRRAPIAAAERALELQASTRVPGTRDRHALLWWAPRAWGCRQRARRHVLQALEALRLGPALLWERDGQLLVLVPRAIPQRALAAGAQAAGLGQLAASLDARGEAWLAVAPRASAGALGPGLRPAGVVEGSRCAHPWSRAHLDLAQRLGQPLAGGADAAGTAAPRLRLAELR